MPAYRCPRAIALFLVVTAVVLAADLGLKAWAFHHVAGEPIVLGPPAETHIPAHEPIVVIPGLLNLRLTTNTGAVFGLGQGGRVVFIAVSVVAVGVIGALFARGRASAWFQHVMLALILAGALGNLYDRALYAQVRDMLHLFPTTRLWPWIFNLADAALMVGVAGVVLTSMRKPPPR